jgi:hypothetical protein
VLRDEADGVALELVGVGRSCHGVMVLDAVRVSGCPRYRGKLNPS